jgi:exosortase A
MFRATLFSIVAIWIRSETFAHGFLVFPIGLFLVWQQRKLLQMQTLAIDWRAIPLLGLCGSGWLLSYLGQILVGEQLTVMTMLALLVWLAFGWPVFRSLLFPLGFMICFAVPMGEALTEPLIQFTALATVKLLQLSGIPVYAEGASFSIPSGDWNVVEACSGLRYLIASLFLGVLYAHFSYISLQRKALFILLAGIMPILANSLRAYLIVMIGHFSDMRLAVGIDHLIYGWVFFGFVMFLLFTLGRLWQEPDTIKNDRTPHCPVTIPANPAPNKAIIIMVSTLIMITSWPIVSPFFHTIPITERTTMAQHDPLSMTLPARPQIIRLAISKS